MKLIKRFIILSGENKGTLSLEKNALGVFIKFTSYGKPLENADLTLLIDQKKYFHRLKGDKESFKLEAIEDINIIHAAVFISDTVLMYGTNDSKRLSSQQISALKPKKSKDIFTPLIKEKRQEIKQEQKVEIKQEQIVEQEQIAEKSQTNYNNQTNYNQQINYIDDAIAEENYYPIKEEAAFTIDSSMPSYYASSFINNFNPYILNKKPYTPVLEQHTPVLEQHTPVLEQKQRQTKKFYIARAKKKQIREAVTENIIDKIKPINLDKHIDAREGTFYEKCSEEIEKIFLGERERSLEKIMPNSRWAKIEYGGGKYYVIGIIGKEYLCYGVPADFTPSPPNELKGYCWWLPLDPSIPQGKGYWIMYQNLITGESILPD